MSRDEILGMASLVGGVGLFSTVEIASKIIGVRADPIVLTFIRFFLTGIMLLILSIPLLRMRLQRFTMQDYGIFLLNGFIGIAVAISIFHVAILVLEKAASAAVIFSVNPVFVLILARFINDEAWTLRTWLAAVLGLSGVICFACESGSFTMASFTGLGLMVLSAALFALSICISRRVVPRYGAMVLMGYSSLFGSIMILPFALLRMDYQSTALLLDAWIPILYLSIMGTAMAYALYYFGLLNTSAQKGGITFFLKPVIASILAVIILGEGINAFMLAGTALILSGLLLVLLVPGARKAQ